MGPIQQAFAILAQSQARTELEAADPLAIYVGRGPHPHDIAWALRTIEMQGSETQRKLADGLGLQELAV